MKPFTFIFVDLIVILLLVTVSCAGCISTSTDDASVLQDTDDAITYFSEVTSIPRASGNLAGIQQYLMNFAEKNALEYETDSVGNICIHHPGTRGERMHTILQAHQDMVPAVRDGSSFVFGKDGIETYVKDGWLYAKETTLGADNGVGLAICLAALSSDELTPYSFDCIFTVDEETNMSGAKELPIEWLQADSLINLDHYPLGNACISSAGGGEIEAVFIPEMERNPGEKSAYTLTISGLLSGHSGDMAGAGRLNALILGATFLSKLLDVQLVSCEGGVASNVIPGSATFTFVSSSFGIPQALSEFIKSHVVESDPGLKMDISPVSKPEMVWSKASSEKFLHTVSTLPDGCLKKDDVGPVLSSNLGKISLADDGSLVLNCLVRGNSDALRDLQVKEILESFEKCGMSARVLLLYPGWTSSDDSALQRAAQTVYQRMFGSDLTFSSIHAGLECGYFAEKNPSLDIISIGPAIEKEHTVDEHVNIDSLKKVCAYTFELVKALS